MELTEKQLKERYMKLCTCELCEECQELECECTCEPDDY